ncbi:hypothetical protein [Flavobacterium silvaticum]|uniref:Uncharacterized protein n=1 Tax=Flavobacterium silvaticum TaxID=1852020 RepID=A0A972FMI2_9FLAO|nr:hypothetical protein [Flavobacterium silvaticum]NMH28458.1 hypothetical protein [Flavobacterium silvaticum]
MKMLFAFVLSLVMAKGCSDAEKADWKDATIKYSAITRGFNQNIQVAFNKVSISKNQRGQETAVTRDLTDAEKKSLYEAASKLDLDALGNYEAPSNKRAYDGAAIASLTIAYKGKTYGSKSFDHGNPPAELSGIINALTALAPQETE